MVARRTFLEISFLLIIDSDRQTFVSNVLTKLKSFTPQPDIAISDTALGEKISEFVTGYPYEEQKSNSKIYHSTQIPIWIDIDGKRKSILSFEQLSEKLIAVEFCFFASEWDEPDWDQKGITKDQLPIFKILLHNLFDTFDYIIGTMGYEVSVADLFDTEETWPNEKYNLENLNMKSIQVSDYFSLIIVNKKYLDLKEVKEITTIGQKQIIDAEK